MPGAATYRKGSRAELAALEILQREGYYATRTPQSRGVFDIIAFRFNHLRLIQVKAYQDYPNPLALARKIRDSFVDADLPCTGLHTWELWLRGPEGFTRFVLNPGIRQIDPALKDDPRPGSRIGGNDSNCHKSRHKTRVAADPWRQPKYPRKRHGK